MTSASLFDKDFRVAAVISKQTNELLQQYSADVAKVLKKLLPSLLDETIPGKPFLESRVRLIFHRVSHAILSFVFCLHSCVSIQIAHIREALELGRLGQAYISLEICPMLVRIVEVSSVTTSIASVDHLDHAVHLCRCLAYAKYGS